MNRLSSALALLLSGAGALTAQQPDPAARLDQIFARWNSDTTPGCAVAVARAGQPVLARAYGMTDLEHDVKNRPETIFEAGSVSKQFTAAAVILLAQDGKLSLNDDVRKYLPELPDYRTTITVRHLLNHTSGLRDWGVVAGITGWPRGRRAHTHEHVVEILSRQRALNFPPGTEYSYSNSGYNLLAVIVDRVSGMAFAEFTRKRLFEPLGMKHTQWRDDFTRIVRDRAMGYSSGRSGGPWVNDMPFENVHGNGGLLTTVGDLLIWNESLNTAKLGSAFVEEMQRQGVLNNRRTISYASGLMVGQYNGTRAVTHTGSTAGYRAFLARYPEKGVSTAILCNAGNANPGALGNQVAAIFLGQPAARVAATPEPARLTEQQLNARAGLYRHFRTGDVLRLSTDSGKLRVANTELVPLTAERFEAATNGARYEFYGATGSRARLRVVDTDGDTVLYEPTEEFAPTDQQLAEFAGDYYSSDAETTFTVAVESSTLVLQRRPDLKLPLRPVYKDAFRGQLGLIRFYRDASGRVSELSIGTARVYELRAARDRSAVLRL